MTQGYFYFYDNIEKCGRILIIILTITFSDNKQIRPLRLKSVSALPREI